MNGVNPWQPASFVFQYNSSKCGYITLSARCTGHSAAGAGGITFATNFHNDVYVFQATTATNVSTTLSIFENPYYFEFELSASQISSVATARQFSNLGSRCHYREILVVVEKNIGENVNNDSVTGAISATQVLASTAYTTNITTSSGQNKLSANSPASFQVRGVSDMESVPVN